MNAGPWLPVPGFEGCYEVSRDGHVRSLDRIVERRDGGCHRVRERILRACVVNGHEAVWLCRYGRYKTVYIRKLLREVFGENNK